MTPKHTDFQSYLEACPEAVREILQRVRETIKAAAPDAIEVISYQMPAFKQHGILVYFAAWKNHIGLYPPVSGNIELETECQPYAGPKGNLQFPLDQPIPYALIAKIAAHRVIQDAERHSQRKKTRP